MFMITPDVLFIFFIFLGTTPQESKGTMYTITPGDDIDTNDATAVIKDVEDDSSGSIIKMRVALPSDSVIGRFKLIVRIRNKEDKGNDKKYVKHKAEETLTCASKGKTLSCQSLVESLLFGSE